MLKNSTRQATSSSAFTAARFSSRSRLGVNIERNPDTMPALIRAHFRIDIILLH
jgi:hypothetical protein